MKRLLSIATPLLAVSTLLAGAFAQTQTPAPQAPAGQTTTAPAAAPQTPASQPGTTQAPATAPSATGTQAPGAATTPENPNPPSREDVMKLMDVMRANQQIQEFVTQVKSQLQQGAHRAFMQKAPNATPEQVAQLDAMFVDLPKYIKAEEAIDASIKVYQKYLTKEDIQAAVTFYSSPTGQRLLDKMPQLQQESMNAGAGKMQANLREFINNVEKKMDELAAESNKNQKPAAGAAASGAKPAGAKTGASTSTPKPSTSKATAAPKTTTPPAKKQ